MKQNFIDLDDILKYDSEDDQRKAWRETIYSDITINREGIEKMCPNEKMRNVWKRKCQTDLAFLSNCVLRSHRQPPLKPHIHGKLIEQFVKKNPDLDIVTQLDAVTSIKERVILASRGMLKSTIGAYDLTQWILCYPNIRILILSGIQDKAETILASARRPFVRNDVIEFLFPDWIIPFTDTKNETFACPKRDADLNYRDETMTISTFGSVKAGGHYELLHLDDCTNEQNCKSEDNVEKTIQDYDDLDPLIWSGGSVQFLGTTWAHDDLPEHIRVKGEEYALATGYNRVTYFSLPAWKLRRGATPIEDAEIQQREKLGALIESDVDLTWPEGIPWKTLEPEYKKNRAKFYKQRLLQAGVDEVEHFPKDLLESQTIPFHDLPAPHNRATFIVWDMGGIWTKRRKKSQSDYSFGVAGCFELSTGKLYIFDTVLTRFANDIDAANTIVDLYQRTQTYFGEINQMVFEDAAGVRYLENTLNQAARLAGVNMVFNYMPVENDPGAKNSRILALAGAMSRKFIWFTTDCPYLNEIHLQFEKWRPTAVRRKDDAPDGIARMWQWFSGGILPPAPPIPQPSEPIIEFKPLVVEEPTHPNEELQYSDVDTISRFNVQNILSQYPRR